MSATTINAFPPLHAFTSSRSWALAAIVLLHLGFFWVLTNGLTIGDVTVVKRQSVVDFIPLPQRPEPPRPRPLEPIELAPQRPVVIEGPKLPPMEEYRGPVVISDPGATAPTAASPGSAAPLISEPEVDPRIGLSQPVYPAGEIRMNHEGTVILAIEVLENGRIGAVRIEQSSGYARLDEAAAREARRWRMIPGTKDGVPTRMWKRAPITFRLQDAR